MLPLVIVEIHRDLGMREQLHYQEVPLNRALVEGRILDLHIFEADLPKIQGPCSLHRYLKFDIKTFSNLMDRRHLVFLLVRRDRLCRDDQEILFHLSAPELLVGILLLDPRHLINSITKSINDIIIYLVVQYDPGRQPLSVLADPNLQDFLCPLLHQPDQLSREFRDIHVRQCRRHDQVLRLIQAGQVFLVKPSFSSKSEIDSVHTVLVSGQSCLKLNYHQRRL